MANNFQIPFSNLFPERKFCILDEFPFMFVAKSPVKRHVQNFVGSLDWNLDEHKMIFRGIWIKL